MPDLLPLDRITEANTALAGGKGASLGRLLSSGFPVPPGFVITTEAYRRLQAVGLRFDPAFIQSLLEAYHRLRHPVAVRSSATAEDGSANSFAGQQMTALGVQGDEELLNAIESCWRSLSSDRAVAYRNQRDIAETGLEMAVVVQELVAADVAGVLFTSDPHDLTGGSMTIESSWGLGEAVVSGRVTPDRFRIERKSGAILEKYCGRKTIRFMASGEEPVPTKQVEAFSLDEGKLMQVVELGRRVESFFREPRDIEWAFAGDSLYLLQARPITTGSARDRESVRAEVIASLRAIAEPLGTVWVRYNLCEVLQEPTPMTWAVIGRLLAADGGFGAMNRDLGARPDPELGSQSAFDLVAGRPMCNLSRLPRLQFARPPFEYPFAKYKNDPRLALDPKPVLSPGRIGWLRLPATIWRLFRISSVTKQRAANFADDFTSTVAPAFVAWARSRLAEDWSGLNDASILEIFQTSVEKTLVDFARDSLKPTVFADLAWQTVLGYLRPKMGEEQARTAVARIALGAKPPVEADLAGAVRALAAGEFDRATFLHRFGHRCRNEMELSQPRWSEDNVELVGLSECAPAHFRSPSLEVIKNQIDALAQPASPREVWEQIATEARLAGPTRETARTWAERLRTYLGLREAAKHYLLFGLAVVRKTLVTLDRRHRLNGGIFYLRPDELSHLGSVLDLTTRIAERKRRRQIELSLEVPAVLFSDNLEAIGEELPQVEGATLLEGVPLSVGTAEAEALVLVEPIAKRPLDPYILVCPSTDPAWVPLFAGAKGLVMETGGVLSHGAIVAREFGLPAVAGLPGVMREIRTGQKLRIDGGRGTVAILT